MFALSCGAAFALLTLAVMTGSTVAWDTRLIRALDPGGSVALTRIMTAASWLTSGAAIAIALLLAFLLWRREGKRAALLYVAACLSGMALNLLLKQLTLRNRPMGISPKLTAAGFYSFPSGNVMLAALIYGFGVFLLVRTVRSPAIRRVMMTLATGLVLLAAISRVYLGAHWPTDVLGALLAGVAWAATCLVAANRWDVGLS